MEGPKLCTRHTDKHVLRLNSIHTGNIPLSLNCFVIAFRSPHSGQTHWPDNSCDVIHSLLDMLDPVCMLPLRSMFRKSVHSSRYGLLVTVSKNLTKNKSQITTKLDNAALLCYKNKEINYITTQGNQPHQTLLNGVQSCIKYTGLLQWTMCTVITDNPREQLLTNFFVTH